MKMTFLKLGLAVFTFFAISCEKNKQTDSPEEIAGDKVSPDGFDYSTTKKVTLNLRLLTRTEQPVKNVMVSVYNPSKLTSGSGAYQSAER